MTIAVEVISAHLIEALLMMHFYKLSIGIRRMKIFDMATGRTPDLKRDIRSAKSCTSIYDS